MPRKLLRLLPIGALLCWCPGAVRAQSTAVPPAVPLKAAEPPAAFPETPPTGREVPQLAAFDRAMGALMRKWGIPGGALAVTRKERLVLARGYGWADVEAREPVRPDALFRIGSLSKSLTAAAVLQLIQENKLSLDTPAFATLGIKSPFPPVDERLDSITVRHLLQHSGGWNRALESEPLKRSREIAGALGVASPPTPREQIAWILGQPLQFAPGTDYAYSNAGYLVLGRLIEKVSGRPYADYVQEKLLAPAGITRMRQGRARLADRAPDEVRYYDYPGAPLTPSIFGDEKTLIARPYNFPLEGLDSVGAWLASPVDLMRFLSVIDGRPVRPDLLGAPALDFLTSRPDIPKWKDSAFYYGAGWRIRPQGRGANWWHGGYIFGTRAHMVRLENGVSYAVLFNGSPREGDAFASEIDQVLGKAVGEIKSWPAHDLSADFR